MQDFDDFQAEDARAAAQIDADVGVEHIADVYAKALLEAAENAAVTAAVLDEFDALVRDVLEPNPKLREILGSALISHDEKCGIIDRLFGPRFSPLFVRFLKVVSNHGRLDCLAAIHRRTRLLYDELRGRVEVELTTASPLSDALARQVSDNLRTFIGGEPVVRTAVDPELIGGVVLRIGDTVYDGSVANQLNSIRQQMIDRSAHEIQSRRNRFRNPAGN